MSSTDTTPRTHKSMRAESDERIVAAAIDAFAERGYHRTTLNQIGAAAGYTGALISNRYGSKAGLARVVFHRILGRLTPLGRGTATDAAPVDGPPRPLIDPDVSARAQFEEFIDRYLQDAVDQPRRLRALYVLLGESLGGMDELDDDVADVNRRFRNHIAGYVRLGQTQAEFRTDTDPDLTAALAVGALRGVVMQLMAEQGRLDPAALTVELRRHLIVPILR